MADIFPGGINALNKDPGIVGVLDMQRRARDSGAARGSQMASNFMQGRKMKQEAEIDDRKMKAMEAAASNKEIVAGYILNGGLPPNYSEPSTQAGDEFPSGDPETPTYDDSTGVPGQVEGMDTTFPAGLPNSMKLQAVMGRMRTQGEILRSQDARNKAAQELDLGKSRVAIGDMVNTALKDGTIKDPSFKLKLFDIAQRTPTVFGTPAFTQALSQHETAFKIQQELTPKAVTDVLGTTQAIEQARKEGREDVATWLEGTMKMPESTPQSQAKLTQGKTEFQDLVTKATFDGNWSANDDFLPKASAIAANYPGLAATDEYKNAMSQRDKALGDKANDTVLTNYLLANQAESAGNNELAAGYRAKFQGQQFESDRVSDRASTTVRGNLKEAISLLGEFKASEFGFSNVGPLVPLVDMVDVGVALGEKVPVIGPGVRGIWEDIAGDPAKRSALGTRVKALERMVSAAMGYEKNVSNVEGQKISKMLQAAERATTPDKVFSALKTVQLILTKENAREHRRALENLDSGSQKLPALLEDTFGALKMLPKGDPETKSIEESILKEINRKGIPRPER